jgi:hypothetical protein
VDRDTPVSRTPTMPKVVNRHPPIVNEDEDYLWVQKMTQCQVKTKVFLVKPKYLDYLQKFLLRVVAT